MLIKKKKRRRRNAPSTVGDRKRRTKDDHQSKDDLAKGSHWSSDGVTQHRWKSLGNMVSFSNSADEHHDVVLGGCNLFKEY